MLTDETTDTSFIDPTDLEGQQVLSEPFVFVVVLSPSCLLTFQISTRSDSGSVSTNVKPRTPLLIFFEAVLEKLMFRKYLAALITRLNPERKHAIDIHFHFQISILFSCFNPNTHTTLRKARCQD